MSAATTLGSALGSGAPTIASAPRSQSIGRNGAGEVEVDDARARVLDASRPLPAIAVELGSALGHVLAEDVLAEWPLPPFDSAAMDGYAVRAADVGEAGDSTPVSLRIASESRAGHPSREPLDEGAAIAISTGAMLPEGADAVVRLERTRRRDGSVSVLAAVAPRSHVRDTGEEVHAGEGVLACGTALGAAELGMLAALGRARVRCARSPLVSVLVAGDELLAPGQSSRPGAIYDANSHSLAALVRCCGGQVLRTATLRDRRAEIEAAIVATALDSDVLLIAGGMSAGEHAHVRPALRTIGAHERVWGLALKPGHATWFGTLDDRLVFGLPGNPAAAIVAFVLLVAPALAALQGRTPARERPVATLAEAYRKPAGRAHALGCSLDAREDGLHAKPVGPPDAHLVSSLLGADALAIIPSDATEVAAGERVQIEPLGRWGRLVH